MTTLFEELGSSYWFTPTVMALLSGLLAVGAIFLDQSGATGFLSNLGFISFNEPSGARSLVSTIASSMITVAGTIFSITLAVLQLTSSQFGPRLLSNFMRDRGNQIVLGTFVSTYIYCLLVIRAIREGGDLGGGTFVPHLAVLLAILFALASLGVFIYFIHHTASSIQAGNITTRISADMSALIATYPEARTARAPQPGGPETFAYTTVYATSEGYLQGLDEQGLMAFAVKNEVVLEVLPTFGTFLLPGQPLVRVYGKPQTLEAQSPNLETRFTLGTRRSSGRDLDFLFAQLTEMALRALSPSTNDAVTAMRCTDRIAQGIVELERRETSGQRQHEGQLRLLLPELDTAELVRRNLGETRRFSADNMLYSEHLLATYGKLLGLTDRPPLREAVQSEAKLVLEGAKKVLLPADFAALESCYQEAVVAIRVAPGAPTLRA